MSTSWIKDLKQFGLGELHTVAKALACIALSRKYFFLYEFEGDLVVTAFLCNNGSPLCDTGEAVVL